MSRELFASRIGGRLWTALRENGVTVELRVEPSPSDVSVGRIIKARVTNILPGIQSAFLDIGTERGGFLHVKDLCLPGERVAPPPDAQWGDDALEDAGPSVRPNDGPIEDRLSVGRELLVQVVRERMGSKGAKLTSFLSIPGRLVVLVPMARVRGVSRRIIDPEERERLRGILHRLSAEAEGFVARTAAAGAGERELLADAEELLDLWREIQERSKTAPAPSVIQREAGLLMQLLRETARDEVERVVVDDEEDQRQARVYLGKTDPSLATRVALHCGPHSLFDVYGLHEDLEKALRARVWLKSGGYLVVEETEALVSIDVNTGRFLGRNDMEQTALRTNLEAVRETARQLRLRDLGGIIVIDFIDVTDDDSRRQILDALERELRNDPARTKIIGLSELGLMQLTRKRTGPALSARLTRACPLCAGQGRVKTPRTVGVEAVHAVRRAARPEEPDHFVIRTHPDTAPAVRESLDACGFGEEGGRGATVRVEADPTVRPDRFELSRA